MRVLELKAIDKFLKDSGIADITETMDGLKTKIDNVKDTLEKNGQSTENALLKSLEEEPTPLDEIRKYGKTLNGFEKHLSSLLVVLLKI